MRPLISLHRRNSGVRQFESLRQRFPFQRYPSVHRPAGRSSLCLYELEAERSFAAVFSTRHRLYREKRQSDLRRVLSLLFRNRVFMQTLATANHALGRPRSLGFRGHAILARPRQTLYHAIFSSWGWPRPTRRRPRFLDVLIALSVREAFRLFTPNPHL